MEKKAYDVNYLPLALDDLNRITNYITIELERPRAADKLLDKIDKKAELLKENPYRFHLYLAPKKLKYEYRVMNIDNYSIFFTVEGKKVEIHRAIYSGRDIATILGDVDREQ